jgi:hypothetical protein
MMHGTITRGTTNPNRLRRVDRWLQTWPGLKTTADPLVVDLGYGASAVTPLELLHRLRKTRPDVELVGLEIDPQRVRIARIELAEAKESGTRSPEDMANLTFELGGFEVPLPRNRKAVIVRAFNVLRQYNEEDVAAAWELMLTRIQPGGVLVDGTCDEIGRIASWIAVTPGSDGGPQSLSIALRLDGLDVPSIVAERLPKALIHRNVEGENIHRFLTELDRAWQVNAPLRDFGATQRWIGTVGALRDAGWPIRNGRTRWRLGELTVDWTAVAPARGN